MAKLTKKRVINFLSLSFGFLVLAVLVYGAIYIIRIAYSGFGDMNPTVASSLVLVAGSVAAILATYLTTKAKARSEAHRQKKVEIYQRYMGQVARMLYSSRDASKAEDGTPTQHLNEEELLKFFEEFHRDLVLWASPAVIKAYLDFRREGDAQEAGTGVLLKADSLILAMRKDLGLGNFSLKQGDMIRIFLKDPDDPGLLEIVN